MPPHSFVGLSSDLFKNNFIEILDKKKTLVEGGEEKEGITLNVSHMNLTENLRTSGGRGLAERIRVIGPNGETKEKDRALGKITSMLQARPVAFKPGWAEARQEKDKFLRGMSAELNMGLARPPDGKVM